MMFTPEDTRIVERIMELERRASNLLDQKNQLKKNDVLQNSYTITINSILEAIKRLAEKLPSTNQKRGGEIPNEEEE